ncbi:hypothetical protein [Actinomadura kijaniata]|uniref:hypothetical protein n=1 Tax=Actinomadura kijaniata TaxID=46161 RepID=UPI000834BE63|nr:hypothetical protein [Actinomadura kijaniata]
MINTALAATALAALLAGAPGTAPPPCKPVDRDPKASVKVNTATVGSDGRQLTVNLTYICTKGTQLAVAAAQPPRTGTAPKYERIGAGVTTPDCDGTSHTADIIASPRKPFTGTWQRNAAATVGANLLLVEGQCSYLLVGDVNNSMTLS